MNGIENRSEFDFEPILEKFDISKPPLFSFDIENNSWEIIVSMNVARTSPAVTSLNGYIYVTGGYAREDPGSYSVELFDPKTDEWTELAPSKKHRHIFTLTESNGYLFAIGGKTRAVERYEPYKNSWKKVCEFDEYNQMANF